MSNNLEIFNEILCLHLRPWMVNHSDQKYIQLLQAVTKENLSQQPLYQLSFLKPLTPKAKYFHAVMSSEATRYINEVQALIKSALNEKEKKYHVHKTLTKKLKSKLAETEKVITSHQFYLSLIGDKKKDKKHRDDAFVIQYLKYQLIRIYLEIQDSFPDYLDVEPLTEDDIHSLYFTEEVPAKTFINKADTPRLPKSDSSIIEQPQRKLLQVIKGDIREAEKGILKYEDIVAKKDRFALAEEELFNSNLIDANYKFIKKRGNIEKMAVVYHLLISKQHFNKIYFSGGQKKITDLHIRKFLNHRYKAAIDKEFRNFKKKKIFDAYINNNSAIALIIPS